MKLFKLAIFALALCALAPAAHAEALGSSDCVSSGAGTLSVDIYNAYLADTSRNGFSPSPSTAQKAMICSQVWAFVQFMASLPASTNSQIGIGVTPGAAFRLDVADPLIVGSDVEARFGQTFPLFLRSNFPTIGFNEYWNGTNLVYGATNFAGEINLQASTGNMIFQTAPSGTAGATATLTTRLAISNGGLIGINKVPSAFQLEIADPAAGDTDIQLGTGFPLFLRSIAASSTIGFNEYNNGSSLYGVTGFGGKLQFDAATGSLSYSHAPSGTGGTAVTNTQSITFLNSGEIQTNPVAGTTSFCAVESGQSGDCDNYGLIGVTRTATGNNLAYFSMTRSGSVAWQLGINSSNAMVIGATTGGALVTPRFTLDGSGNVTLGGSINIGAGTTILAANHGSCTLNGASPSTCSLSVASTATCVTSPRGTTAAAGIGLAHNLSGTTLTVTGPNLSTIVVDIVCN